jgi:IclR family acetate operon transcriptional repressor
VEQQFQETPSSDQPGRGTTAIDRGAELLVRVLESDEPVALTELATASGIPKSTASRLLSALERQGLVEQEGERGRLRPGPAILRAAERNLLERSLIDLAGPSLDALAQHTGETINLAVPTRLGVEHIAQVDSRHFLGTTNWTGRRLPHHCTAVGKVLLAFGAARLPAGRLDQLAPDTITDRAVLDVQLEQVRARGYGIAIGELEPGLVAIAAPVFAADGRALAAISISGPALRLPPERLDEMGALLVEETTMLSERLGHRRPKEGAA